jgi:hypothetical protein
MSHPPPHNSAHENDSTLKLNNNNPRLSKERLSLTHRVSPPKLLGQLRGSRPIVETVSTVSLNHRGVVNVL